MNHKIHCNLQKYLNITVMIQVSIVEILLLTVFFTSLAIFYDIHGKKHVLGFITNHIIALLLALIISKTINTYLKI
jgi:hypothetical protein